VRNGLSPEDRQTKEHVSLLSSTMLRLRVRRVPIVPHAGPTAGEQRASGGKSGAFSMAAGEYISMRVQREVFERLIHLEAHEIGTDPNHERIELTDLYIKKGVSPNLAVRLAEELMRDPAVALETHAREELGLDPKEGLGSPWVASGSSFATLSVGAFIPLIPFSFLSGNPAVILSGLRMMALGAAAAAITYGVGRLLGATTGL